MSKPPLWFTLLAAVALFWNLAGLAAVVADLRLSAADVAALSLQQQALYAARPSWSVVASVVAVCAGTFGCIALLLRRRRATPIFYASLVGVVVQDIGIFLVVGAGKSVNPAPLVLQGLVLAIAVGLIALSRLAAARSWLRSTGPSRSEP